MNVKQKLLLLAGAGLTGALLISCVSFCNQHLAANERAAQAIAALVDAAARGDFTRRVDVAGRQGFFKLFGESVATVANGTELIECAGKTMGEVVGSVKRVSDMIADISAALVEQATAAARSLEEQSGILSGKVNVFRLDASQPAARSAQRPVRAPLAAVR